jgi:hypothetical protein
MLRQYHEIKQRYPGTILFFRLGDFYEMFFEDAITGSRELEITLTARNKERGEPVPRCAGSPITPRAVTLLASFAKVFAWRSVSRSMIQVRTRRSSAAMWCALSHREQRLNATPGKQAQ